MIYHITSRQVWNEARERGDYRAESLETEGYIHCSTESQVLPVAQNFYKGQSDLYLLVIEPALLAPDLKWEPPSGGTPPPGVPEEISSPMFMVRSIWTRSFRFLISSLTEMENTIFPKTSRSSLVKVPCKNG